MSTWGRERALHYHRRQKFDRELQSRGAEFSKYTDIRRQAYDKLAHTANICLERLVVEQQKEFFSIKFTPFLSKNPKVFVAAYFRTERFQHTTVLAQRALRAASSLSEFKGRLAGQLVEEMAYYRMAAILLETGGNSGIVLAPERTLEFYTSLHPGRKEQGDLFAFQRLSGISVPDGVVVTDQGDHRQIAGIMEAKALRFDDNQYLQTYRIYTAALKQERKDFPDLFSKHPHMYYVTLAPESEHHALLTIALRKNVTCLSLPLTHKQLWPVVETVHQSLR
jgi:hypothetical protein